MNWLISLAALGILPGLFLFTQPVTFESLESTTETGGSVYNQIKFFAGFNQDVWIMRQSHSGLGPAKGQWDRLAIVVDKTQSPKIAKFYQLEPGQLNFEPEKALPLKARCFACHSNGPRAIRPKDGLTFGIALFNLRIKSYGVVKSEEAQHFSSGVSFKSELPAVARPILLKSCVGCHSPNGIRNSLTIEQLGTVEFMVRNGLMPPFPFKISKEDYLQITGASSIDHSPAGLLERMVIRPLATTTSISL